MSLKRKAGYLVRLPQINFGLFSNGRYKAKSEEEKKEEVRKTENMLQTIISDVENNYCKFKIYLRDENKIYFIDEKAVSRKSKVFRIAVDAIENEPSILDNLDDKEALQVPGSINSWKTILLDIVGGVQQADDVIDCIMLMIWLDLDKTKIHACIAEAVRQNYEFDEKWLDVPYGYIANILQVPDYSQRLDKFPEYYELWSSPLIVRYMAHHNKTKELVDAFGAFLGNKLKKQK